MIRPRALLLLLLSAACALLAAPAAADTMLADASGVLRIEAPGRWRMHESEHAIYATGFLNVKRAEVFAVLFDDVDAAAAAATRWKRERSADGADVSFTHAAGDPLQWSASKAGAKEIEYARALDGAGRSAVVWVRLASGSADIAHDAFELLALATLATPKAEAPETGAAAGGDTGTTAPDDADAVRLTDKDLRLALRLPAGFTARRRVELENGRVLSASGPIGSDEEAYLDLYAFPEFDRSGAAAADWQERERRGWARPLRIEGEGDAFRLLLDGETWTRHARVIHTKAGVYGVLVDAESGVDQAVDAFVDALLRDGIEVTKPRPETPQAPPGLAKLDGERVTVFHAGTAERGAAILAEAEKVDGMVAALIELDPWEGRKGVVRVYEDADALAAALRPYGVDDVRAAHWVLEERAVYTHLEALGEDDSRALLREELAREALQRRFGFRPPFWLERGVASVIWASVSNRGRLDLPHDGLLEGARNAAGGTIEFEAIRWWIDAESRANPERRAVAWSFVFLFTQGGATGKRFEGEFRDYVRSLHSTGSPAAAGKSFDFAREADLVDAWKKWVRQL